MKCPTPETAGIDRQQIGNAIQHFTGCFVREREQQNISRIDPVFEQVSHTIGKRSRFSRARAGDHKDRAGRGSYRSELLFVQFGGVIDMDRCRYWGALQCVLTGHIACPFSPAGGISPVTVSDELRCCRRRNTSITNSVRRRKEELPKSTRKQSPSIQTPSCM